MTHKVNIEEITAEKETILAASLASPAWNVMNKNLR